LSVVRPTLVDVAFATEHPVLAQSDFRPVSEIPRTGGRFEVISDYQPAGDQPAAIDELERRVNAGEKDVVLLGATGTGKSATTAWLIERVQRPTLVMAPNKTLAAQLANELRELFPNNAVEYFVSYYDYYQPEAYIAQTDTYIEKDSSINDDVERLRPGHPAVLPRPVVDAEGRHAARPGRVPAGAGGRAVHAQRHRVRARHVPRARRHGGDHPGVRGAGHPGRVLR
jgi:hypothetical protein